MIRRILWVLGGLASLLVIAVVLLIVSPPLRYIAIFSPLHGFDPAQTPPAPDYATDAAWVATPTHLGLAALVPPNSDAESVGADSKIDVFFIHPTTYLSRNGWNARFDEDGASEAMLQNGVVRIQAGAFNGCCRIYAPRYRQATFYAFIGHGDSENAALDLAYHDVLRAFDEFIEHHNQGRPFILAAHSQGSLHGMRLLQERIAGTPLAHRLVAAYLIGYSIPVDMKLPDGIGPCRNPTDTGCYLSWNSLLPEAPRAVWQKTAVVWLDKRYQPIDGRKLTCVNPLTYQLDDTAPASANLGGLAFPPNGAPLEPALAALTGAACTDGVLLVTPPRDHPGLTQGIFDGSYHIYDYNLFYTNLRQNLAVRTGAFLKTLASSETASTTQMP